VYSILSAFANAPCNLHVSRQAPLLALFLQPGLDYSLLSPAVFSVLICCTVFGCMPHRCTISLLRSEHEVALTQWMIHTLSPRPPSFAPALWAPPYCCPLLLVTH
jgi:hypothetical protein